MKKALNHSEARYIFRDEVVSEVVSDRSYVIYFQNVLWLEAFCLDHDSSEKPRRGTITDCTCSDTTNTEVKLQSSEHKSCP